MKRPVCVCESEVMLKILADDRYCGRVIGKEGKVIKKIREDTDTHIVVSKSVSLLSLLRCCLLFNMTHTLNHLRPFFRDHPGEPVPEENFWTL